MPTLSRNILKWLKDISNHVFSTPSFNHVPFNPRLFNHELFSPGLFNHEFLYHGVEKFMVEKSGVEKSLNLLERWQFNSRLFNPRLFNRELFNPMVQKFMVEKFGVVKYMVEKSGVERSVIEALGWKVQVEMSFNHFKMVLLNSVRALWATVQRNRSISEKSSVWKTFKKPYLCQKCYL